MKRRQGKIFGYNLPYAVILQKLMEHPIQGQSTELNDNRISLYVAQRGKCAICKEPLLS